MSQDPGTSAASAGRHVIIECFGGQAGFDSATMEALLRRAAAAGGACVLSCHMHRFGVDGGVTGVALLAQSHITVHTWPEHNYAAFDVFMCGDCDADQAAEAIVGAVPGSRVAVRSVDRPTSTDWREDSCTDP